MIAEALVELVAPGTRGSMVETALQTAAVPVEPAEVVQLGLRPKEAMARQKAAPRAAQVARQCLEVARVVMVEPAARVRLELFPVVAGEVAAMRAEGMALTDR